MRMPNPLVMDRAETGKKRGGGQAGPELRTWGGPAVPSLGAIPTSASPQTPRAPAASPYHAGSLDVPVNKSQVVNADRPIAKAMIGNDDIADILPITDRSIYVLGKKMGTTSLTLYDGSGQRDRGDGRGGRA